MAKYTGEWRSGSSYNYGYQFNTLADAKKTMRAIARGNTCRGDRGRWSVADINGDCVASGYTVAGS